MNKSCNIGFLLLPEVSCYNAAFGLARALQQRGHNVVFFVGYKSILWEHVEAHGFKAAKTESLVACRATKANKPGKARGSNRSTPPAPDSATRDDRLAGPLELDLCFVDNIRDDLYPVSTLLAETGVAVILLSANFASTIRTRCPPVFSSMPPPDGVMPTFRLRVTFTLLWLWAICTLGRGVQGRFRRLQRTIHKLFNHALTVRWERRLRRLGWRSSWGEWRRRPLIPEVVFGHRELDWPALASDTQRFYFGGTDLLRKEAAFDWSKFEADRPIVYCSVSTAGSFRDIRGSAGDGQPRNPAAPRKSELRVAKRYLDDMIEAFSQRKDWQLILSCGGFYDSLRAGTVSSNIHLFPRVPQLAVLERADLTITWGGAGTVRECVNFGVPMLVFPLWSDQFGNAARVLSRNLGESGDVREVTPHRIIEMVERVLTDDTIRASMLGIRTRLNTTNEVEQLVRYVNRHTSLSL